MAFDTSFWVQRRLRLLVIAGGILACLLLVFFFAPSSSRRTLQFSPFSSSAASIAQFHLLLPATAANLNLCRLLLSCAVTGFPEPIFLGWDGHGMYDGAKSHLFKISETLAYLERLPPSADDDLVLVLDAYDVIMQLRPDVLITRYLTLVEQANERLATQGILGKQHGGSEVRETIFFGPDKTCWPTDDKRAACWAVPESTMDPLAFGPDTDTWMVPNRPRWLNSGTIMGPAKDMRDMFHGTMLLLNRTYNAEYKSRNSDQLYFQDTWGEQEVARSQVLHSSFEAPYIKDGPGYMPTITDGRRTEYHMALDYGSYLFQTSAAYTEYCTWMRFNNSLGSMSAPDAERHHLRMDQYTLPDEVANSPPPMPAAAFGPTTRLAHGEWRDMSLGVNTVTQQVFPLFHMTGEKKYRDDWWARWWFHPHGEALLKHSQDLSQRGVVDDGVLVAEVGGRRYVGAKMRDHMLVGSGLKVHGEERRADKGGAWSDQGEWIGWEGLCGKHEGELFLRG